MRLSHLLANKINLPADADGDIAHLQLDSRLIQSHDLFLAVKGKTLDGRHYIDDAIQRGAKAILVEVDHPDETIQWKNTIPLIPIYQLSNQLGPLAARFYDSPIEKLSVFGVTGTSGKTSCTHFIAQVLQKLSLPCGVIGTLGSGLYGSLGEAGLTTPDAIRLQATLRDFVNQGAKAVAMEVSSHSIDQGRIAGMRFDVGMFTNLTQDHLDYHGTMAAYAATKRRLFAEWPVKHAVINADDEYGAKWLTELSQEQDMWGYTTAVPKTNRDKMIYVDHVSMGLSGIQAMVYSPFGQGELTLPLIGRFNLSNALAVLGALCLYGLPFKQVLLALSQLESVPGRMQLLGGSGLPLVVVDYAHKPDALEKTLQALSHHVSGQLICVFGCGGDRDRGKRPKMAAIAERFSDLVIVTNDNPRNENPNTITEEIMLGFHDPKQVIVSLDRTSAIQKSIQLASAQDCILIAGKGAEHYQQIGSEKIPFDDVEQATHFLNEYKQKG